MGPAGAARGALLAAALAAGALAGCSRGRTAHVESVRIAETSLSAISEVGLDRTAVEEVARAALSEAGFRLGPGEPAYRARVEVVALRLGPSPGGPGLRVDASAELELVALAGQEPARRELGAGGSAVAGDGPGGATRRALAAAVGEAARALRVALAAERKPVAALLEDLESSDVRVRDQAVQALGDRRERQAVPALIRRLADPDRQVRDRAIGALGQIKDPRAVPQLIDLSRGSDSAVALRLVPVVGDIGGADAEGWLLTIEQAHPEPRVREAATEALAELRRRQGRDRK